MEYGCHALRGPGAGSVGAPQTVVDVDPAGLDPERGERVTLGGEVLRVGGADGVGAALLGVGGPRRE